MMPGQDGQQRGGEMRGQARGFDRDGDDGREFEGGRGHRGAPQGYGAPQGFGGQGSTSPTASVPAVPGQ